jgi:hypothetical protein
LWAKPFRSDLLRFPLLKRVPRLNLGTVKFAYQDFVALPSKRFTPNGKGCQELFGVFGTDEIKGRIALMRARKTKGGLVPRSFCCLDERSVQIGIV